MLAQSRFRIFWTLVAVLALRLVIGWHFYSEGTSKLKDGNFSAEPFFRAAKGPLAPFFQRLIPDHDGRLRLSLVESVSGSGKIQRILDPLVTEELWKGFAYRAARHYGFGNPSLIESLERQARSHRDKLKQLETTQASAAAPTSRESLERALAEVTAALQAARVQKEAALASVQRYIDEYRAFLEDNQVEILAYFQGADRGAGFDRDGSQRSEVIRGVSSLRGQSEQIAADRTKDARPWLSEVDQMWNGVEADINALAVADQKSRGYVWLERPYRDPWALLPWIDRMIPWFDTVVGGCLILGLFTRLASLAGAGFLAAIVATQPPFVAGAAPTIYQMIELVGLLVLFASCAGRIAGLDVFLHRWLSRGNPRPTAGE